MKKVLIFSLAIALASLFAMPANATESRQVALGGPGNYIEDDFNIFWYPGTLPHYSNTVWMNINSEWYGEYYDIMMLIGATYGLGEDNQYGVVGMWFWQMDPGLNPFGGSYCDWTGAGLFSEWQDHKFAVMWGYAMEGASFGVGFMRADDSYQWTDTEPQSSSDRYDAYTLLTAGVRFDVGDNMYMDVAFDYAWASYKEEYSMGATSYDIQEDKNKKYALRVRGFYDWKENFTWVPYFMFESFDFMLKSDIPDWDHYGDKATHFAFGLGSNITVNEDNLIVFAVDLYDAWNRKPSENPDDASFEEKWITFPRFYLGLESDVTDWLTFRGGAVHELVKQDFSCTYTDTDSESDIWTWSEFEMFLGLGFHVGDFDIDCVLNPRVPLYMGYWLTGFTPSYIDGGDRPIWMVSGMYHF